ncbi:MAG TPA: hypothetical protein VKS22_10940 [Candidatus Binataceae bacterium]|nr:hypothetical protein [Candidatus Binataceae bacterium]
MEQGQEGAGSKGGKTLQNHRPFIVLTFAGAFVLWLGVAFAGSALVSNPAWQFIGPKPIQNVTANFGGVQIGQPFAATGRITAIAADPTTSGRLFVGTAGAGVWMSSDGGNTFTRISGVLDTSTFGQGFPQTTVGALALNATTNPPTIFLATGEGNGGDSFWGDGLFSTANLGSSWSSIAGTVIEPGGFMLPSSQLEEGFTRLAIDTSHSPPYVYAAAVPELGTDRAGLSPVKSLTFGGFWGLWRSTDGGSTFTQYAPSALGGV